MSAAVELPPLDEAAGPSAVTAMVMSEVARASYTNVAMQAFAEADRQFGAASPFSDPGHLVRDIVGSYLISAGDFVCGLQYVIAPDHGLTFSSASLARSACELANKASWVAADGLTMGQRIARSVVILKEAFKEEKDLLDEEAQAGSKKTVDDLERWRTGVNLPPPDGPYSARALFKAVRPDQGARDYKLLSNAAHGSFLTMFLGRRSVMVGSEDHAAGAWWRVLTACMYGYHAAVQVCALQGQPHTENMLKVRQLLEHYTDLYDRWQFSQPPGDLLG